MNETNFEGKPKYVPQIFSFLQKWQQIFTEQVFQDITPQFLFIFRQYFSRFSSPFCGFYA